MTVRRDIRTTGAGDASPAPRPRPTRDFLGHRLMKAALRVRASTAAALAPLDLSPQEFGLLNQVVVEPGLTQARLGALLGIDRTTIVAMLDRLVSAGRIERVLDDADRRVHRITATSTGRAAHSKALAAVSAVEDRRLSMLDARRAATLLDALGRIGDDSPDADVARGARRPSDTPERRTHAARPRSAPPRPRTRA